MMGRGWGAVERALNSESLDVLYISIRSEHRLSTDKRTSKQASVHHDIRTSRIS